MRHDDIVVRVDIHGEEERLRVLWNHGSNKVMVQSICHPERKAFPLHRSKIIRTEGRRTTEGAL